MSQLWDIYGHLFLSKKDGRVFVDIFGTSFIPPKISQNVAPSSPQIALQSLKKDKDVAVKG